MRRIISIRVDNSLYDLLAAGAGRSGMSLSVYARERLRQAGEQQRIETLTEGLAAAEDAELALQLLAEILAIVRRMAAERNPQLMAGVAAAAALILRERGRG